MFIVYEMAAAASFMIYFSFQCSIQDSAYWPMNMNAYKFGFSGPGSTSYYSPYEVNDNLPIMDVSRTAWEYPSVVNAEEPTTTDTQFEGDEDMGVHAIHEERSLFHFCISC